LSGQDAPGSLGVWTGGGGLGSTQAVGLTYGLLLTSGGSATAAAGGGRGNLTLGSFADTGGVQYVSFLASGLGGAGYKFLEFQNAGSDSFGIGGSNNGNSGVGNAPPLQFTVDTLSGNAGFLNSTTFRNDATNFFVIKIDYTGGFEGDVISWWLNPNVGGAETPTTFAQSDPFSYNFNEIRVAKFTGDPTWTIDEIRFGSTWESVTPIPEPSSYGVILGAGVLFGVLSRRKRRA